ncbi:MAG: DsbA family protein [Gammaproteobacteria bacterium]|nr:DsbA family protein [Gammaproteobacteria bacterium]
MPADLGSSDTGGAKILIVTDPMCSWCWGMTPEVDRARAVLPEAFDLLMGGINIHGTQPIGEFGRGHLMGIWREVQATTGQAFGFKLPTPLIYNSTLPCIAVQAVRQVLDAPPFDYLHRLQERFFVEGADINNLEVLAAAAQGCGLDREAFLQAAGSEKVRAATYFQMSTSRDFGTSALPSVLEQRGRERRLLAGGYLTAEALLEFARRAIEP